MPELPEVEVTKRSLAPMLSLSRIASVRLGKPLRWPLGCEPDSLNGRLIQGVRRRGKYLLIDLDEGLLLLHLGMSGSVAVTRDWPGQAGAHDHFDLETSACWLRLHDPRRFGAVVYAPSEHSPQAQKLLGHLGLEPLEAGFTAQRLLEGLSKRSGAIKQVLLGGDVVVGVGNIYASEALFMSGIRPTRAANRISKARVDKLYAAIRTVLARAIDLGGSSLRDFKHTNGEHGLFQASSQVYGRAGEPCTHCQAPIKRIVQGQRATYFCASCQR
jgi:formamidopyrimidine-DNA glycosylase